MSSRTYALHERGVYRPFFTKDIRETSCLSRELIKFRPNQTLLLGDVFGILPHHGERRQRGQKRVEGRPLFICFPGPHRARHRAATQIPGF